MCGIFFYCFNLAWRLLSHTDLHVGLPLFAIAIIANFATLSVYTYAVKLHEVLFFGRGPTRTPRGAHRMQNLLRPILSP